MTNAITVPRTSSSASAARRRLEVRRFRPGDEPAIEAFNRRLAAAGQPHRVGCEGLRAAEEPSLDRQPIIERLYVAAEGGEIRGGVWLKEQVFWTSEGPVRIGWSEYPVAESLVSATAAGVPASLVFTLLREQPALMALGMGGLAGPLAKLLAAARWNGSPVPFFFRLIRPSRVLRQLSIARATPARRRLADGLACSGVGWMAWRLAAGARALTTAKPPRGYTSSVVNRFEGWADELWQHCRDSYGFVAVRDARALNALYPEGFRCLDRLRVRHGGRDAGWVCARAIDVAGTWFERHFGNLRLGILTDAFAQPADAGGVLAAGVRHLTNDGVDLIVTFQTHPAWRAAAVNSGLFQGPSNCAFYRSPAIERVITSALAQNRHYHLTYSDGDGPQPV